MFGYKVKFQEPYNTERKKKIKAWTYVKPDDKNPSSISAGKKQRLNCCKIVLNTYQNGC